MPYDDLHRPKINLTSWTKLPKRDAKKLLFVPQGRPGSDHSSNRSYRMTFEEQRPIQEEVRNTGVAKAADKVQALRDEKAADRGIAVVGPPVPGRDSGFCSEQDQLTQQTQGEKKDGLRSLRPQDITPPT